ncbi:hypothetical protein MATR_03550 [Marivirga tractuosa]|uniref:Integral membrane protein n=1 Tax=Marivirga tractuosa (strain ATCC 23168 / DSM 4126 / NBRC 15989 / NCIMB 1408 / VKM B-1430 / H-43) TaxID=643867 RepID=E4TTV6_MARTH|nr:hypothetical protein [Marivirga tractuosa]ADR22011.1 hypothetical protein Ftrac_2026 [Marivirga tractuosa DSM 4126]BDD13530.1 hypothetical protein MATR_03550 [Marivirga tractuosa]
MISKKLIPPRKIFIIDAIGALLTATTLAVFVKFQEFIGMPTEILMALSLLAVVFFVYSLGCHLFLKAPKSTFLRVIAFGNLFYTILTSILVFIFFSQLELLGRLYFIAEAIVLIFLVITEFSIAKDIVKN